MNPLPQLSNRPYPEQVRAVLLATNKPPYRRAALWRSASTYGKELGLPGGRVAAILRSLETKGLVERRDKYSADTVDKPPLWASTSAAEHAIAVLVENVA